MRHDIPFQAIEAARPRILAAERHIWNHPETGYREWNTHAYLKAQFEALGVATHTFDRIPASVAVQSAKDGQDRVFKPIPGFWVDFDTGRPGPRIAIFGELDALLIPTHPECDKATGAVHACGHHAQCAALLGVAAGLSAPGALAGLSGAIRLIAVPAEECTERDFHMRLREEGVIRYIGGKQELLWRGVLDDVDLAFMVHTKEGGARVATTPGSDGFIATNHVFLGKAAHAGAQPHAGVNALYAANLALNAANALRETFRDDLHVRFHPIITSGGASCNVIPERVVIDSSVRAASLDAAIDVNRKINRAFAGAAAAMGCRLEVHDRNGYAPRRNDAALNDLGRRRSFRRRMPAPAHRMDGGVQRHGRRLVRHADDPRLCRRCRRQRPRVRLPHRRSGDRLHRFRGDAGGGCAAAALGRCRPRSENRRGGEAQLHDDLRLPSPCRFHRFRRRGRRLRRGRTHRPCPRRRYRTISVNGFGLHQMSFIFGAVATAAVYSKLVPST